MFKTFLRMTLCASVIILIAIAGEEAEAIIAVHGEQVSALRGEICWFMNGVNEAVLLGDDNEPDQYLYLATEPVGQKIAVRFVAPETPLLIKNIMVLVGNVDIYPDLPGDPVSPFNLNISADSSGFPGEVRVPNRTVAALGMWDDYGEWVPMRAEYLLDRDTIFWGVFSWLEETPASPVVGVDYDAGSGNTVVGYTEGGMIWEPFQTGNVMMRAEALKNDKEGIFSLTEGVILPDSFRIYFSGQPIVYPDEIFYDTTVIGKLHSRVVLPGPDNYFCVTSFKNNQESPSSRVLHIQGSSAASANLDFYPDYYDLMLASRQDTSLYLVIENDEDEQINFRVAEIAIGETLAGGKIGVGIIPSEGIIPGGQAINVRIDLSTGETPYGQYQIELTFAIWDQYKGYRDRYLPIGLQISEYTAVDDNPDYNPEEFSLGQNYPNPFNSQTVIPFNAVLKNQNICLEIFDLLGRRIYWRDNIDPDLNYIIWEGEDTNGHKLPSGLYFYKLSNGTLRKTRKMIYLK